LVINGANSNPGKDKSVFLRGAKSEYTVFLIDGIPVSDPSGPGGAFDPRLLPLNQLERIEILKGSQSTLYGSDAIAGVINLITKKSGSQPLGGNASLVYGSYDMLRVNGIVNGSTEFADFQVGFSFVNAGGISEAEDINNTGTFDKDGFTQHAVNGAVTLKINPSFTISPFLRVTNYKGDFDGGAFMDDNSSYTSMLINPGLRSQYTLKNGAINFLYGHNTTNRKYDGPFGPTEFNGRFDNADFFINRDITEQIQILAGLNYQNMKLLDASLMVADPDAQLISPYVSVFLHHFKGLAIEVGGRYNQHSKYGNNFTYSFNPSFTLSKSIKFFMNQSTGFKVPTLSQLYGNFGANENLKPEISNSFEAGIHQVFSPQFEVSVSWFKRTVKDVIVYTFTNGNINQDEQNDRGLEVESRIRLNDKLTIITNYAFVDGKVSALENGVDTTYNNLFRRPKHSLGINMGVQASAKLYFSLNLKTFSERQDLFFNPDNFFAAEVVTLKSYALVDAYASYSLFDNKLRFFVEGKNILNQDYREVYGYNTMGFNVHSGLSFKF
jgi:vitamin B12 transporter